MQQTCHSPKREPSETAVRSLRYFVSSCICGDVLRVHTLLAQLESLSQPSNRAPQKARTLLPRTTGLLDTALDLLTETFGSRWNEKAGFRGMR